MDTLQEQIEAAEDKLAQLKRKQRSASCAEVGCDMQSYGGTNAGCYLGSDCGCSVPVLTCTKCGDSDYGDNQEAKDIRERCRQGSPNF